MGSGSSSSGLPETHEEYYLPAQLAFNEGNYNNASMMAYMSNDSNFMSIMSSAIQQKQSEEKMAALQAKYDEQSKASQAQSEAIQASNSQASNASQKSTANASAYTTVSKANANAGNQTQGQVSGATTARKTLQGFGDSGEDMQDDETWY